MATLTLILAAYGLASSGWLLKDSSRRVQTPALLLSLGLLFVAPWLPAAQESHTLLRVIQTLVCCAVLAPKLLDAYLSPTAWNARRFRDWLGYLLNPYVLVYRARPRDPGAPTRDSVRLVLRGLLSMTVGGMILFAAFGHDFTAGSFWVEHTVKTLGFYLLFFDGQFVLATGLLRLITGRSLEFCRSPILAHSPADFWRRYNRDAGRFLAMNVLKPLVGLRALFKGAVLVFLVSGALHEYLAWVLTGRLLGHQSVFFALQGLAAVLTFAWRPAKRWRWVGIAGTLAFNLITSALFFASVDLIVAWYDTDNPLAWP